MELYLHSSDTPSLPGAHKRKYSDNFTFHLFATVPFFRPGTAQSVHRLLFGRRDFFYLEGTETSLFATTSRKAPGSTQPPVQWVSCEKSPKRDDNHSTVSSVDVKKKWSFTSTAAYVFIAW
jgi:hypothetical protein